MKAGHIGIDIYNGVKFVCRTQSFILEAFGGGIQAEPAVTFHKLSTCFLHF